MPNTSLESFPEAGFADLGTFLDPEKSQALRAQINRDHPLTPAIFYDSVEEFEKKGRWERYAPGRTDHNYLVTGGADLSFIEENEDFLSHAEALVGPGYQIMKKSVIRSVNRSVVPEWIIGRVRDLGRPNLNPFVRDDFQNVQHFLHTDYHQDKTRPEANFVTVYIYLDQVDAAYSALRILEGSHKLGLTPYPHNLRGSWPADGTVYYSDGHGNHLKCKNLVATGGPGTVVCFHDMTLHGTVPNDSDDPRISLRYLITPGPDSGVGSLLDRANRLVIGPHSAMKLRQDVSDSGEIIPTGSSLLGLGF